MKYSLTKELSFFADSQATNKESLSCLNHMVTDALECIPDCLKYMQQLQTPEVFRFCAITQIMAIATLAELYNNSQVFSGVVKIRKGLAILLINDTRTQEGLHKWFNKFAGQIRDSIPLSDPNAKRTREICTKILSLTQAKA
jgi:farnesyl-diphosphate farnesyltransferase